jgi:hypothetical protein
VRGNSLSINGKIIKRFVPIVQDSELMIYYICERGKEIMANVFDTARMSQFLFYCTRTATFLSLLLYEEGAVILREGSIKIYILGYAKGGSFCLDNRKF